MLTKGQEVSLENIQKKCLRTIYGYKKSYNDLLEESGLQTLKDWRVKAVLRFARKTAKNPVYTHWFKPNPNLISTHNPRLYLEEYARTQCLQQPSIPHAESFE